MSEKMNEEKLIMEKIGAENPFRVPNNYFNEFPQRIMKRIERQRRRRRIIRWSIAAMLAGCVLSTSFLMKDFTQQDMSIEADNTQYIDDALDYSMINNMEIATYLTEAE